jgi:hypothetical protein
MLDMLDSEGRGLEIKTITSGKSAGFRVMFFVTNILVNTTQMNFLFFAQKPHTGPKFMEADRQIMVSEPFTV